MKTLSVNFIPGFNQSFLNPDNPGFLNGVPFEPIDSLLWSDSGYQPQVSFRMAYTESCILLSYQVAEKSFRADYLHVNEPVYRDSCVEFFVGFDGEKPYYNLEFNALGTALVGYGIGRNDRVLLNPDVISGIKKYSTVPGADNAVGDTIKWQLMLMIPFNLFHFHQLTSLRGSTCRANFYKCGDDLPDPHFLSWSPICSPEPNFHLPEYFGRIDFL